MRTQDESQRPVAPSTIFLAIICAVLLMAVAKALKDTMIPIVLAFIFFFLFSPLTERLDRHHVPHAVSVVVCFLLTIAIMVVVGVVVYKTASMLIGAIPHYNDRIISLDRQLSEFLARYPKLEIPQDTSLIQMLPVNWRNVAVDALTAFTANVINIVKMCVMILLYELFLLMERPVIIPKLRAAFVSKGPMLAMMSERISRQVSTYLLLKAVISLATGFFFYLIALCSGMEVPLMYGVLAFVFNFIPSIGSIIVTVITIGMAVIQFAPEWSLVVFVAVGSVATQMILGNIIDPKLQGGQLNLSPLVILVSLAIWGYVWGVVGMFLAVPITSCMEIICANVKVLRPVAVLLSGGRSLLRQSPSAQRKQERKARRRSAVPNAKRSDFVLPDDFNAPKKP